MSNKTIKQKPDDEEIYEKLSYLFIHMEEGLEIRDSNLYENRVTICRGKDLVSFMKDNVEEVAKHIMTICQVDIGPKGKNYMQNFYDVFLKYKILTKIDKMPDDKKRFPKRLAFDTEPLIFEENKFYIITAKRSNKKTYFWLITCVVVVLLVCLFPVWPLSVKLGLWWILFVMLLSLLGLFLFRVLLYSFFFSFGIDLWIFPDLFNEKCGIPGCFKRVISVERRRDCWRVILIRIGFLGMFSSLCWIIYLNQDYCVELLQHFNQIFDDILEFGYNKIINNSKSKGLSVINKYDNYMKNIMDENIDD